VARIPPVIRKRDLANILSAVRAAGGHVSRVEVTPDGKVVVITATDAGAINPESPEDALLKAIHNGRAQKGRALPHKPS
jgi:hypothetical protein